MLPVNLPGFNIQAEVSLSGESGEFVLENAPGWFGVDFDKRYLFVFAWQPNREDLDALNNGKPVIMKLYTDKLIPHTLLVP